MKRIIPLLTAAVMLISLCSCDEMNNKRGADETDISPASDEMTTEETSVLPDPMAASKKNYIAEYGSKNGKVTATGFAALPERNVKISDPDNANGLSTEKMSHAFGVPENEKPNWISVENQKIYEKYDGICYDTSGEKYIYLTFDCGYENGCTADILDTLKEKKVKAAFFVTMDYIKTAPELVARMIKEGHTVGNHSHTHPDFSTLSRRQMADEILDVENVLRSEFGYFAPFFRFPAGNYNESALEVVEELGYRSVFWSSAYADWDTSVVKGAEYAFSTVTKRLHPGCVLLLHAVSADNTAALGDIIDFAVAKGYEFRSL